MIKQYDENSKGTILGHATLCVKEKMVILSEETLENIRKTSPEGKCILDTECIIVPGYDSLSFSLVEKQKYENGFLNKLEALKNENELVDTLLNNYKVNSVEVMIENGTICLTEQAFTFADYFKGAWAGDSPRDFYDLVVSVRDREDNNYKDYYLYSIEII